MSGFKGAMSKFYGEQRAQVKGIKERSLVNKARNEAKKEMEEAQSDQPLHFLRVDGRSAAPVRNDAQFFAIQQNEGLVPWAARPDVLIDRYDVRSLLDIYVDPDPRLLRHRQRSAREVELDEQVVFETCRDLIRLKCLGLSERQGIKHAEQENVAIRAQTRTAAVAALEATKGPKPLPSQNAAFTAMGPPVGTGQFAAVGFSYGGGEGSGTGGGDEGGGGGSGDEREAEEEEESDEEEDAPATAEDQDMDATAFKEFGIEDFSSMLRWAMRGEAAEAEANRRRNRRGWSRKKARLRAKRLHGQGLDPSLYYKGPPPDKQGAGASNDISWIPERKPEDLAQRYNSGRGSPEYEPMAGRGRSRSPASRRDRPQAEFITSFASGGDGGAPAAAAGAEYGSGSSARRQQQGQQHGQAVKDALPGAADPALEGPAMLPAAAYKLHGVRPDDSQRRDRYGGSVSGRDYSRAKAAAATPAATVIKAVDKGKETPQERLKRLMAAQLNKKIQKDSLTAAQKQQQEEAERRARMANEVAAQEADRRQAGEQDAGYMARGRERSRSPRQRSRSPPERYRRRSRSRSRSRSGDRYRQSRGGSGDHRRRSRSRSRSHSRDRDRGRERQYYQSRRSPSSSRHHSSRR